MIFTIHVISISKIQVWMLFFTLILCDYEIHILTLPLLIKELYSSVQENLPIYLGKLGNFLKTSLKQEGILWPNFLGIKTVFKSPWMHPTEIVQDDNRETPHLDHCIPSQFSNALFPVYEILQYLSLFCVHLWV